MEINGIAHTMLTVGDFERSRAFYSKLLPFLGLTPGLVAPEIYYCVGGRTAFGLRPCADGADAQGFNQGSR